MIKKDVIKRIGKKNWLEFMKWMRGQTCGMTKDGKADYDYEWDVVAFITKLNTGYDRQNDSEAFD